MQVQNNVRVAAQHSPPLTVMTKLSRGLTRSVRLGLACIGTSAAVTGVLSRGRERTLEMSLIFLSRSVSSQNAQAFSLYSYLYYFAKAIVEAKKRLVFLHRHLSRFKWKFWWINSKNSWMHRYTGYVVFEKSCP